MEIKIESEPTNKEYYCYRDSNIIHFEVKFTSSSCNYSVQATATVAISYYKIWVRGLGFKPAHTWITWNLRFKIFHSATVF
jgi:hypothetical protein